MKYCMECGKKIDEDKIIHENRAWGSSAYKCECGQTYAREADSDWEKCSEWTYGKIEIRAKYEEIPKSEPHLERMNGRSVLVLEEKEDLKLVEAKPFEEIQYLITRGDTAIKRYDDKYDAYVYWSTL